MKYFVPYPQPERNLRGCGKPCPTPGSWGLGAACSKVTVYIQALFDKETKSMTGLYQDRVGPAQSVGIFYSSEWLKNAVALKHIDLNGIKIEGIEFAIYKCC